MANQEVVAEQKVGTAKAKFNLHRVWEELVSIRAKDGRAIGIEGRKWVGEANEFQFRLNYVLTENGNPMEGYMNFDHQNQLVAYLRKNRPVTGKLSILGLAHQKGERINSKDQLLGVVDFAKLAVAPKAKKSKKTS